MNWREPRAFLGIIRGVIMGADDSKKMQTVDFRGFHNERLTAERPQIYGVTTVPPAPDGNGSNGTEVMVGFVNGNRSHPVVLSDGDARTRPKNLKPGESKRHDDQGQNSHIARDGHYHTAKQHVMSATEGDKPLTTYELNEQLKGVAARMSHIEHSHHGLFDVTSQFRQIVQGAIPAVAAVAPILNQDPTGLTKMTDAIVSKEPSYLQTHIKDALGKFLSPNIDGVGSVLGGGIEGLIQVATAQLASLVSANPVVTQVEVLVDELANLQSSGSVSVVSEMAPIIQGLIDSATAANPVIGQAAGMKSKLAALMNSAGSGINFLAPQQRLVQGLSKSMKLAQ
jgi:hypothetical protein